MGSSWRSLSSFLGGLVWAFSSVQLHVASLKILVSWALNKKQKGSTEGKGIASKKMKSSRRKEVEKKLCKLLRSWDGVVLCPPVRGSQGVFSPGDLCSAVGIHLQGCQQSCAAVTALLLANLDKQEHWSPTFCELNHLDSQENFRMLHIFCPFG